MRNMERVIFGCLMLCGFVPGAWACTTGAWNGGTSGGTAGSPPTISRVSELCAFQLAGTGWVQDNSPSHTTLIARFFVLPALSGSAAADIFVAYSSESPTGVLFDVAYNAQTDEFEFTTSAGSTGISAANGWNLIEVAYSSGGNFDIWVNADATTQGASGMIGAGSGTVEAVRLGLPNGLNGLTGEVFFDDYESHATTPVGTVLWGDANNDGNVNSGDTVSIINENLGDVLAVGVPDCNRDGNVNSGDTVCIINRWLGS